MECDLAIVIPAYKGAFLARTLASIAAQTDRRFRVYIGDDASPDSLQEVVRQSAIPPEQCVYQRFQSNLGSTSLIQHWHRCIALSKEPWIWLFSDDDEMDPDCVKMFYECVGRTGHSYDIYRFNTVLIDHVDRVISINPPHPAHESWKTFAYFLFRGLRFSTAQEVIYSRPAFERAGGYLELAFAWGSDHALLLSLGRRTGIALIPGALVRFRMSGENISTVTDRKKDLRKLEACLQFADWARRHLKSSKDPECLLSDDDLEQAVLGWIKTHCRALHMWFGLREGRRVLTYLSTHYSVSRSRSVALITKWNIGVVWSLLVHKCRQAF